MRGLLADVNVQRHALLVRRLLLALDLWPLLAEKPLVFPTMRDLELSVNLDDRAIWTFCQREGWVSFTENRNDDGLDSLHSTMTDSWTEGDLPVVTLADKGRFEHDRTYAERVAADVAELLYGIAEQHYRDRPRIYVPLR